MKTKSLMIVHRMVNYHGSMFLEVEIPSWKKEIFKIPAILVPRDVMLRAADFSDNCKRFYVDVNLEAKDISELGIENFQNMNLFEVFRKKENE